MSYYGKNNNRFGFSNYFGANRKPETNYSFSTKTYPDNWNSYNNNNDDNYTLYGSVSEDVNYGGEKPSLTGSYNTAQSIKGYIDGGSSGGGGTPWGAIGAGAKTGYNALLGKDDADYSDMEESIIYPLQGASAGASFGPWGAAAGALYGLGYSFKDDLGLDDNEWYTDLLFPIGLGDEHEGLISL